MFLVMVKSTGILKMALLKLFHQELKSEVEVANQ